MIGDFCAGCFPDAGIRFFNDVADGDHKIRSDESAFFYGLESLPQCFLIVQHFLGVGIGYFFVRCKCLIQLIVRGDDVLDFRTEFCLMQNNGVKKY